MKRWRRPCCPSVLVGAPSRRAGGLGRAWATWRRSFGGSRVAGVPDTANLANIRRRYAADTLSVRFGYAADSLLDPLKIRRRYGAAASADERRFAADAAPARQPQGRVSGGAVRCSPTATTSKMKAMMVYMAEPREETSAMPPMMVTVGRRCDAVAVGAQCSYRGLGCGARCERRAAAASRAPALAA